MSTEIVPSVGAEQITSKGVVSGSRPSGLAGEIFDRLQKSGTVEAPQKAEELAPKKEEVVAPPPKEKEGTTEQALADAGKEADKSKEAAKPDEKKDEKGKKPSIRSIVKASNIPADDKEAITNLAYIGFAMHQMGFTPEFAKLLKEQGITPASIDERIKLHPTVADAQRDSWFGSEMRRVAYDYNTNPQQFLLGLKQSSSNNPDTYKALIEAAATHLKEVSRPTWVAMLTDGFRNALYNLGQEAVSANDEETQAAVAIVQSKFGFPNNGVAVQPPAEDPEFAALKQKNAELEQRQKRAEEQSKQAFLESIVTESRNAVFREVDKRWRDLKIAGLTEEENVRAINDIFYGVEEDLSGVSNFVYDMMQKRNAPQTEKSFRDSVQYAFDRALPFIPKHQTKALGFWSKRALAASQNKEATEKKAAQQVDAAEAGGTAPAPPAPNDKNSVMKTIKSQPGLTFQERILAGFGARK